MNDISTAHRLKSKKAGKPGSIVIRFLRCSTIDLVYLAKSKLKAFNDGKTIPQCVFINEDLTKSSRKLFRAARFAKKTNC